MHNRLADALSHDKLSSFLWKGQCNGTVTLPNSSQAPGTAAGHADRLDLSSLERYVQFYFNQSLAPSTHRTYQAATKRFSDFCSEFHISTPYPLTQHLLCQYVSYLGSQGLSPATIKVYLSALRRCQISMGMPSPDHASMPKLQAVQVGVAKTHAFGRGPRPERLPITPAILRAIKTVWSSSATERDTIMNWAICTLAFFGFFRLGKILLTSTKFDPE